MMGMNGVTEDVVTVLCGGKEVNKSLAVHAALEEGFGVSDKIDDVLMLHTSEGMVFSGEGTLLPPKTMEVWYEVLFRKVSSQLNREGGGGVREVSSCRC